MSAKDFFLTELPPLIAEIKGKIGDRLPKMSYDIEFEIEGEGMYSVVVKNGEASVRRGGVAQPLLSLQFAKATFDEALREVIRPRLSELASIDIGRAEAAAQKGMASLLQGRAPVALAEMLKHLKAMPLRLRLEVEPLEGKPTEAHRFELRTAGAEDDDPTIVLQLKREDLDALLSGKLAVQDAFKQQKLRVTGAVSSGMALLSRLFVSH